MRKCQKCDNMVLGVVDKNSESRPLTILNSLTEIPTPCFEMVDDPEQLCYYHKKFLKHDRYRPEFINLLKPFAKREDEGIV